MPNLKTKDGDSVAENLSAAEVAKLREMGVDVNLSDPDGGGDSPLDGDGTGSGDVPEASPDEMDTKGGDNGTGDPGGDEDDGDAGEDGSDPASDPDGEDTVDDSVAGDGSPADDDADGVASDSDAAGDGEDGSPDMPIGDSTVDPDDPAEEFADRDRDEMIEESFDVDMDSVRAPDKRDRARWASLVNQLSEYGKNIPKRKRERDERDECDTSHEEIRRQLENDGVIRELKDGFQELVSRPTPRPARQGPRLDMNNIVRRASGDTTVRRLFEESVQVETGDRCIGLSTDISGSMYSDVVELKKAGAAIAKATSIIGDAFVWNAFTDEGRGGLDLRIVTGPHEEFEYEHLDSFTAAANEPTAAGIRDCRMLMERTAKREYTMIVITDGKAMVGEDGTFYGSASNVPVEHAREAVRECRDHDIDVIGLGIGGMSDRKMRETFGEGNYKLTSIDDLADDIIELYEGMMNVDRRR